jgi:hypothetical protein
MRTTYHIEAIRSEAGRACPRVLDRMIVRASDLESVKRQAILLFETARAPQWTRPHAQALRVVDQMGVERFRCA